MERRADSEEVVIVGAGLVGALLSILLARRFRRVVVYERRPDPRSASGAAGRSINLVVTSRGVRALERAGLWRDARRLTVAVHGRMIHAPDGSLTYQPYGRDDSECNHSISRLALNRFLIEHAERAGVRFRFGRRLVGADFTRRKLVLGDEPDGARSELDAAVVIGADGAGSALRTAMRDRAGGEESVEPLTHGYKELSIPAAAGGAFRIDGRALHLWPRGGQMLMALANPDGSFTATLYLPASGRDGFAGLTGEAAVRELFRERFADAVPLIPELTAEFFANPTGTLGTVRFRPWHVAGHALLVGDAAHPIVPFFGQGMNCGFEDCTVLDSLLDQTQPDWEAVMSEFERRRRPDAEAIADMALDNFVEMRDRVADPAFLLRKEVEHRLERELPREYRSRYSMVVYSHIPYAVAQRAGEVQQAILDELCTGLESAAALDLRHARVLIAARLTPLLRAAGVDLDY